MTVYLMWAIVLLLAGLALMLLEAFLPSGGALGLLAVIAVLGAVGLAYFSGPIQGTILLVAAVVATPAIIYFALKWWPNTPIGRRILLDAPNSDDVLPDSPQRRGMRDLLGKVGKAKSLMLPSGAVLIDGKVLDAVSEGVAIEAGQAVKVVEVRANRIVVRPVDEEEEPAESPVAQRQKDDDDDLL